MIGNVYTTVSVALIGIGTSASFSYCARPPSPTPAAAAPSLRQARPTTAPDPSNVPQVFYPTQEIEVHSLEDLEHIVPRMPTVHRTHPVEDRHQARNGRAGHD